MRTSFICLASALYFLLTGTEAVAAHEIAVIDRFTVVRSGKPFFEDTFTAPTEPPQERINSDGSPAKFLILGVLAKGSESGGKLTLHASDGSLGKTAGGAGRHTLQVRLVSDSDPKKLTDGLKSQYTFTVSGLFDYSIPQEPVEGYGLQLEDFTGPRKATDVVQLFVFRDESGSLVVRFLSQDFTDGAIRVIADAPIDPAGGNQILLTLSRSDLQTKLVTAAYQFLKNGKPVTDPIPIEGSASVFNAVNWTRAGYMVFEQSQ
jgi:hypothetical protein